ncbi:DUF6019 family protein [Methanolapillus africanus]
MIGGIGTTEIILIFMVLFLTVIPLVVLYYIIKLAVRNGVREAKK